MCVYGGVVETYPLILPQPPLSSVCDIGFYQFFFNGGTNNDDCDL